MYKCSGRMVELEQICEVAGRKMVHSFEGQQQQFILGTITNLVSLYVCSGL